MTLAALTVDSTISCAYTLGSYCTGGDGGTGLVPCTTDGCGLGFCEYYLPPDVAINSLDHQYLQSTTTPKVVDFGSAVNTVFVFPAVDHGPFPEEGIEFTVWGSDTCDISNFPSGWTLGTLTTIWKKGWEDPAACQGQDNSDDFTGQYTWLGSGFRYVAVHANLSISIFNDPTHTTWSDGPGDEDNSPVPGWQSYDDEIDAVGTPTCAPDAVVADAGPDQFLIRGEACFDASGSSASGGIATIGWDINGDAVIDVVGPEVCLSCEDVQDATVTLYVTSTCGCVGTDTVEFHCVDRVDSTLKGSLLFYSKVELRWNAAGALVQDTVISLLNDYPADVNVQLYFVNGDAELDPVFSSGPAPILIAEGEPGWNWVDCALLLTPDQPVYWSAATGNPIGCQPFAILDPDLGNGPGRPDPEGSTDRVLRGFIIGWAIDAQGNEICWNHLSGKATIVNYADASAWEYSTWAFQSAVCDQNETAHPDPGVLHMDGLEYARAFDMLLFDFFASGSQAFSRGGTTVTVDTDLTLHLLDGDFRENSEFPFNPPTTKAHFDIWNMNERKLSNTRRCITCWDQTLISNYGAPNNMLLVNMQSDKGKARIDGKQANECEENCLRDIKGDLMTLEDVIELLGDLFGEVDIRCSIDASLLGVAAKHLTFSGGAREVAGDNLVGMGVQAATIRTDLIDPPGTLREDAYNRIGRSANAKPSGSADRVRSSRSK